MSERAMWTERFQAGNTPRGNRVSKYHAQRTELDGFRFDSKREARRYQELKLRLAAGEISMLIVHPRFQLNVIARGALHEIGVYTADFSYRDHAPNSLVVEDVKSAPTKTTAYRLRKRLVEAIHGITIREV